MSLVSFKELFLTSHHVLSSKLNTWKVFGMTCLTVLYTTASSKQGKKYLQGEGLSCSVAETCRINVRGDWRCPGCMWWLKSLLLTLWACSVPHFLSQICHPLGHHSLTGDVTALCLLHTVHASVYLGRHCRCRGAEEVSFTPCHN